MLFGTFVHPANALYVVPVRQTESLQKASFRLPLTMGALGLGYTLPITGRVRDFHPLDGAHAGRTTQKRARAAIARLFFLLRGYFHLLPISWELAGIRDRKSAPVRIIREKESIGTSQ